MAKYKGRMLAENTTAKIAAKRVCAGIGRNAQKNPIAKALAMVFLFHFQSSGSVRCLFNHPKLTFSRLGLYFFKISFTLTTSNFDDMHSI